MVKTSKYSFQTAPVEVYVSSEALEELTNAWVKGVVMCRMNRADRIIFLRPLGLAFIRHDHRPHPSGFPGFPLFSWTVVLVKALPLLKRNTRLIRRPRRALFALW